LVLPSAKAACHVHYMRRTNPGRQTITAKSEPSRSGARVLYLSYDGMCDPLGGSQVLPYLFGLAQRGHEISLISFEKAERTTEERAAVARSCAAAGIDWQPLTYHKQPPVLSSMYDLRQMSRLARRLHKERKFDLVHCRSYLPSLVGLRMKRRAGVPFVFDMRGFWADERLEGGAWNQKNPLFRAIYNLFKRREGEFWREADEIVSLTRAGERVLSSTALSKQPRGPITVIPCCVDFDAFPAIDQASRHGARELLGISSAEKVLGYIGSLGGNYLLDEMLDFFSAYQERYDGRAKFLFVTRVPEDVIRSAAAARGVPNSAIIVRSASRAEVPRLMAAADAGIAFKQPTFSAKACSPTKLGEMLALELPVVTNSGVGDVARVIEETDAGVVVHRFDDETYHGAVDQLERLKPDMDRWRTAARRWFDLAEGVERYDAIYRRIMARADKQERAS
jgi:glycosyltransferase involved in cell wall biosynthesis